MSEPKKPNIGSQILTYLGSIFALENINYSQSIEDIKQDVSFKGANIWILICSILVCSLGLNMNSTAVVIGAMLISPLMGPIVGLGLGIGVFDKRLIWRALNNLGIAAGISILTAFIFFRITPTEEVPEILARTHPTLLDLFVAFFGGIAGILASAKSLKSNVVPGVAIATALMPPLCTAGFGLAIGNFDYFAGALYLFLMNSIMISVAALIVVLYLRYPKFSFVDARMKKRVRTAIIVVVLLVSVPSGIFYYNLLQENYKTEQINNFIEKEIESLPGVYITNQDVTEGEYGVDSVIIHLNINGNYLEADKKDSIEMKLSDYGISHGMLKITQPQPLGFKETRLASLKSDIISELYQNSAVKLENKDDEIAMLKSEIEKVSSASVVSDKATALAKSQFRIQEMAVDVLIYNDGSERDTIPTAIVSWEKGMKQKDKTIETVKLQSLLKIELSVDTVKVIEYN
jgi:uncharacterized hydrophobic protein (TIGR00271 family)